MSDAVTFFVAVLGCCIALNSICSFFFYLYSLYFYVVYQFKITLASMAFVAMLYLGAFLLKEPCRLVALTLLLIGVLILRAIMRSHRVGSGGKGDATCKNQLENTGTDADYLTDCLHGS